MSEKFCRHFVVKQNVYFCFSLLCCKIKVAKEVCHIKDKFIFKNMIYGEKPDFDVILEAVKHLEDEINAL